MYAINVSSQNTLWMSSISVQRSKVCYEKYRLPNEPNCWPCAERCILFGMPVDCQFVFAKQSEIPPPYNILLICLGQHWSKTGYNGPLHTIFVRIFAFGFATTYCIFRIANKLLSSAAARKCISNLAIFSAHSIQCVYWGNLKEFIYTCRAHIHIYRYSGSKAVSKFSFFEANFRFAFACTTPTLFVVDFILCCCGLCRLWAKAYDEASNFWLFRITHFRFVSFCHKGSDNSHCSHCSILSRCSLLFSLPAQKVGRI